MSSVPTKKRKKSTGSARGFPFERLVCKALSEWWAGEAGADIFWRTAQSGGRSTTRKKAGKKTTTHFGDVCATDPSGAPLMKLFTIDLKRGYPKTDIQGLFEGHKGERSWYQWILDAQKDAAAADTPYWMVIQKRDRRSAVVVMPYDATGCFFDEWFGYSRLIVIVGSAMSLALLTLDDLFHHGEVSAVRREAGRLS